MKKYFKHLVLILLAGLANLIIGVLFIFLCPIIAYFAESEGLSVKYKDIWEFNYEF